MKRWFAAGLVVSTVIGCRGGRESPRTPTPATQSTNSPYTRVYSSASAWFTQVIFNPTDTLLYGIPVRTVDSAWRAVLALDTAALPPEARQDSLTEPSATFGYVIDHDLDGDGRSERTQVGVFKAASGVGGAFVAVLRRADSTQWRLLFKSALEGDLKATFLWLRGDSVFWAECVSCDAVSAKIYWAGTDFVMKADSE